MAHGAMVSSNNHVLLDVLLHDPGSPNPAELSQANPVDSMRQFSAM